MYIQNVIVKSIKSDGLSFPLPEGSVVTVGGVTGIVPTTIDVRPATNRIYVAVAGTVDLTSDANKGVTFTDEQIQELGADFNFVPAVESGGGGGETPLVVTCTQVEASETQEVYTLDKNYKEISTALESHRIVVFVYYDEGMGMHIYTYNCNYSIYEGEYCVMCGVPIDGMMSDFWASTETGVLTFTIGEATEPPEPGEGEYEG